MLSSVPRRLLSLAAPILLAATATAKPAPPAAPEVATAAPGAFSFRPAARYRNDVPSPLAILGHDVGAEFVTHSDVVRVAGAIGDTSRRVRLEVYGESGGGRPLLLLQVSSPANLARLDDVGAALRRLMDPRSPFAPGEREGLLDETPAVVWLSFGVHGNEAGATEAALPLLYHLAAAQDPAVEALLEHVVVVIDPCLNPDGRERYVHGYDALRLGPPDADPRAIEHAEPWPGGRSNRALFDLNRDWAFATQPETRARLARLHRLPPQVHVDFHEMDAESSYFFFPAAPPINDNVPAASLRWGERFGAANAAAFDRFGWTYYTAEEFDLFYPGYGDSWPTLAGAIGMTYEQAGHGRAGLHYRRADGGRLTLADRAAHHFTAALATIEAAAGNRRELLDDFATSFERAVWEGAHGPVREFVLVPGSAGARADDLAALLLLQGIEVGRAVSDYAVARAHRLTGVTAESHLFPPGAFVVRLEQPHKRLAKALLEPRSAWRVDEFYDVSAWSLPLLFGVEAWWCEESGRGEVVPLAEAPRPAGAVADGDARVGFVTAWDAARAARFANLLRGEAAAGGAALRVRAVTQPFTLDGIDYAAGALFVPRAGNPPDLDERVARAALRSGVHVRPVSSGLTPRGPDLGSDRVVPLAAPRVALVAGAGTSPASVGQLRHVLVHEAGLEPTLLPLAHLAGTDLRGFDALLLPDGHAYGHALGDAGCAALERFVAGGGLLIAIEGAAFALGTGGLGLVDVRPREDEDDDEGKDEDENDEDEADEDDDDTAAGGDVRDAGEWLTLRERREKDREANVPGTLFRARLDPEHPLSFGLDDEVVVLLASTRVFEVEGAGTRLGVLAGDGVVAGFVSAENAARLAGKACIAEVAIGRGHVVLFANDPAFRAIVRGQSGLLLNALTFLSQPDPAAGGD